MYESLLNNICEQMMIKNFCSLNEWLWWLWNTYIVIIFGLWLQHKLGDALDSSFFSEFIHLLPTRFDIWKGRGHVWFSKSQTLVRILTFFFDAVVIVTRDFHRFCEPVNRFELILLAGVINPA